MDQSYRSSLRQQQQQSPQQQNAYEPLPPPSQLGSSSNFRTNTLPPLNVAQPSLSLSSSTVPASPNTRGYPPPTYNHPSLSNAAAIPTMNSWPAHRASSSRDDFISQSGISPPLRRVESRGSLKDEDYDRIDRPGPRDRDRERERERERDVHIQQDRERREQRDRDREDSTAAGSGSRDNIKHEGEDGMPSTSDFVKKLYK